MSNKRLDDLLSQWPMASRSQLEWDDAAERITQAIEQPPQRDAASLSDDALLAAPLPKLPEEGQTSAPARVSQPVARPGSVVPGLAVENKMSKERGRDRSSFQELAKLASMPPTPAPPSVSGSQTPPPSSVAATGVLRAEEASSTDSGIVDLKMIAMLDPSGEQRAQSTALASEGLFDDDQAPAAAAPPASKMTPAPASASGAQLSASAAAPAVAQAAAPAVKSAKEALAPEKKKGGGGVVIVLGTLLAVGAIAAGGVFFVKWQKSHHQAVATTTVSAPEPGKAEAKQGPVATAATPTPAASVAQADTNETIEIANPQPGGRPLVVQKRKPGPGTATETPAPVASGGIDPKLVANVPTGPAGGGSGDLAEAMKAAAGAGANAPTGGGGGAAQGPAFAAGSVPQRPSQGQVQGAIGAVMGNAKACLGADDPVSHANVVFQSDGTVKSVSISGFAAGKPQEACIKSALSKAKVDPFAEASYSIPVSVRP